MSAAISFKDLAELCTSFDFESGRGIMLVSECESDALE